MRTLLVGDLHLKAQIILPMVEKKIRKFNCQRVILMGDYTDAYDQNRNLTLYIDEVDYLVKWKLKMQSLNVEVITLLGNHDSPYITHSPKIYSVVDTDTFTKVGDKLFELGVQIAFKLDDYLVSHAGFTEDYQLEDWHLSILSKKDIEKVNWLENRVGDSRGGTSRLGSPLWADFEHELCCFPNKKYLNQIVAHTPQKRISFVRNTQYKLIAIDTFTVKAIKEQPYFELMGNGEILMYQSNEMEIIPLDWMNKEIIKMIESKFYRNKRIVVMQGITFDFEKWSITINDNEIFLTNKEFDIFVFLFENQGTLVSAEEINIQILSKYEASVSIKEVMFRLMSKIDLVRMDTEDRYIFQLEN